MSEYLVRRISPKERYEDLIRFPRYFEIETVNACNARCPMCTIDDWERRDGLMSDELFKKITNEISRRPEVLRVHLYRDGEPLLDKKLPQRVRMLKSAGVREVGISTNAALLNDGKARALLEAGLDSIILSIDSMRKEVYEKIRVRLSFEEVSYNIHNFIVMRDAGKYPTQVWVRMIRQESNRDEWSSFQRYWKAFTKPTDRVDYRDLHNWGGQLVGFDREEKRPDQMPCVALWSLMVIFADGTVPRCNVDFNKKHPVGNLNDSTISQLWTGKIQNQVRQEHLHGIRRSICAGCDVWTERSKTEESFSKWSS